MKIDLTITLGNYEKINDSHENLLTGGFSSTFSISQNHSFGVEPNNCHGGNCSTDCGGNSNNGCNTVAGCGTILK